MNKLMCLECEVELDYDKDFSIKICSCDNKACFICEDSKQMISANNLNRVVVWDNSISKYRKINLN